MTLTLYLFQNPKYTIVYALFIVISIDDNMSSVPKEIIDQARNCPYDFACIKDPDHEQYKKTHLKACNLISIIPKAGADINCNPYT